MEAPLASLNLDQCRMTTDLVKCVYAHDEPVIVYDGECECLVAMRPEVLERILFDTSLLNMEYALLKA